MFVDPGTIRTWWPGSNKVLTPQQTALLSTERVARESTGLFTIGASTDLATQNRLSRHGLPTSDSGLTLILEYLEVYRLGVPVNVPIANPAGGSCVATKLTRQPGIEIVQAYVGRMAICKVRDRKVLLYSAPAPRSPEALINSALTAYSATTVASGEPSVILPCYKLNVKGSAPWLRGLPWGQKGTVQTAISMGEITLEPQQVAPERANGAPIIGREGLVVATIGLTGLCHVAWISHGSWLPRR